MHDGCMSIKQIFLDMDGVLADFFHPALAVHGRTDLAAAWPKGTRSMTEVLGIDGETFLAGLVEVGESFWSELPPEPWFGELMDLVEETAPFSVLTSPYPVPCCLAGKMRWMNEHLAPREGRRLFKRFALTRQKRWLAAPGRILIDDSEDVIADFERAGGHGVLLPQPWNRLHNMSDRVAHVRRALSALPPSETSA